MRIAVIARTAAEGRPATVRTQAIVDELYTRLCDGESLRQICKDHMPARSTIFEWIKRDPEFRATYELALVLRLDGLADDIIDISDDATHDWVERKGRNGKTTVVVDLERINRDRLRADSRKWLLARMLPKKYGDRAHLDPEPGLMPSTPAALGDDQVRAKNDELAAALDKALAGWNKRTAG